MDNCTEFAALLDSYIDGELSQADAARVREHLAVCGRCRDYVQAALAIRDAFPTAEDVELPEHFTENVMAAVLADKTRQRSRRRSPWAKRLAPLAACCAVVVLAASVLPRLGGNTVEVAANDAAEAAITAETAPEAGAGEGGQAAVTSAGAQESTRVAEQGAAAADEATASPSAAEAQQAPAVFSRVGEDAPAGASEDGTAPAPANSIAGFESESVYKTDAGTCFATLTLTPEQAGSALEDLPPETPVSRDPDSGGTVYFLTAEQFQDLLERLDHPAYTAEGDGSLARVILLPE